MDLQLGLLSNSRSDFTLRIKDLSWCPGPESNRHALRRGILRKRAPLRAIKNGVLKAHCILYNVLYNDRSEHKLTTTPLLSKLHQHHTGRGLLSLDKAMLVGHLVCDTFKNPADSKLDNLHVFQLWVGPMANQNPLNAK
jgi:hypothetical protein